MRRQWSKPTDSVPVKPQQNYSSEAQAVMDLPDFVGNKKKDIPEKPVSVQSQLADIKARNSKKEALNRLNNKFLGEKPSSELHEMPLVMPSGTDEPLNQ